MFFMFFGPSTLGGDLVRGLYLAESAGSRAKAFNSVLFDRLNGLVVLVAIGVLAAAVVWLVHRLASDRVRRAPAWDCGFPDPRPETQYSGASFAQPLRRVFGPTLLAAREKVEMPAPGEPGPARLTTSFEDPFWRGLYQPVVDWVGWATERSNALQFLTIRRYLTLMFLALAVLLTLVAVSQ